MRQPLGDLRLERLGAAFDQRDDEVVRLRNPDEPVLDVEPDLRVIDMGDHEYPGVRRRALKPRLPTIRRELWMRQQRAGSGYESAGWRHFGRKEPGGAKAGGGRARRQPFGQLPNPAASQANAGGETPQRRGYPPRRRGQEAFHLAPVLVCGRFQMRDPDEKRFVLVAQRIEKVVRLPHTHPRHFSQAFRCRSNWLVGVSLPASSAARVLSRRCYAPAVAEIKPFRAVRYDESKAGPLASLVAPPYDVIGSGGAPRVPRAEPVQRRPPHPAGLGGAGRARLRRLARGGRPRRRRRGAVGARAGLRRPRRRRPHPPRADRRAARRAV